MDIVLGIVWLYAVVYASGHAWQHARQARQKSRGAHVRQAEAAAGGTLSAGGRRRAAARHDAAWWAREGSHGFPVMRTGWHTSWLAHRAAADHHAGRREEARTTHLETRASLLSVIAAHKKRQAEAQALIDGALEDAGGGKKAAQKASDELAAKRAAKTGVPPLPADGVRAPDDGAAHLKAPMPDPRLNDAQRERDQNGRRNICAACGHPGTAADPLIIRDGFRVHESHTTDPADGFYEEAKGSQEEQGGACVTPGCTCRYGHPDRPASAHQNTPPEGASPVTETAEMNYTAALEAATQIQDEAEGGAEDAKKIQAEADTAVSDTRRQRISNAMDALTGLLNDGPTLSEAAEVDDALRADQAAAEALAEAAGNREQAAQRLSDAAEAFRAGLVNRHGGIKDAVDDAPAEPAEMAFYKE